MAGMPDRRYCLGAANGGVTYARRYALFTLVGIAGEDDLDAPDLNTVSKSEAAPRADDEIQSSGDRRPANWPSGDQANSASLARPVLAPDQSATLRDRLVTELSAINSADEAAAWAHRNLPAKNSLTTEDAQTVEAGFQARLSVLSDYVISAKQPNAPADQSDLSADRDLRQKTLRVTKQRSRSGAVPALRKTVRLRDKDHRKFVTRQPCLVCGRVPSDSHHLTFVQPRALGQRVSDEFTVPVCRIHHRELHRSGDEAAWWRKLNIDPLPVALRLWQHTRADVEFSGRGIKSNVARKPETPANDQASAKLDSNAEDFSG